jgi:hypothetical protein
MCGNMGHLPRWEFWELITWNTISLAGPGHHMAVVLSLVRQAAPVRKSNRSNWDVRCHRIMDQTVHPISHSSWLEARANSIKLQVIKNHVHIVVWRREGQRRPSSVFYGERSECCPSIVEWDGSQRTVAIE